MEAEDEEREEVVELLSWAEVDCGMDGSNIATVIMLLSSPGLVNCTPTNENVEEAPAYRSDYRTEETGC